MILIDEKELYERFRISRMTVRQSIRTLTEESAVESIREKGDL
ncbi:hypothetical protein B5C06_08030 [Staphylococcus delphini]|nr:hypothetical protein B5C06_08030 [Staphylococcus delphini]